MNTPLSDTLGLSSPDGRLGQLLSVQAHGTLLGLVMRLSMVQTWRNVSGAPMAARFGFALGCDQSLLGLQVERAGQTESPSRIEREGRHRCSVSLGILGTGEQLTVRWQIGQLLNLQGGSLRIQLPAALAPRAPRPLKLGFDIFDPVARGTVSSPSHDLHRVRHGNGVTLTLRPQAQLDKDLVLTVHGLRDMGFALAGPNLAEPGTCTVLVSSAAQLQQADEAPQALRMKLLLDDGPSMPADRLSQIRTALDHQLGGGLDHQGQAVLLEAAGGSVTRMPLPALPRRGLVVNATGPTTIRLLPPLVVSDEELAEALKRLRAALGPRRAPRTPCAGPGGRPSWRL